jgi:hypothetical protein
MIHSPDQLRLIISTQTLSINQRTLSITTLFKFLPITTLSIKLINKTLLLPQPNHVNLSERPNLPKQ